MRRGTLQNDSIFLQYSLLSTSFYQFLFINFFLSAEFCELSFMNGISSAKFHQICDSFLSQRYRRSSVLHRQTGYRYRSTATASEG